MKQKYRWKIIIQFVSASLAIQEDAVNRSDADEENNKMYKWLTDNFQLSPKKKKSIFGLLPNPPQQ